MLLLLGALSACNEVEEAPSNSETPETTTAAQTTTAATTTGTKRDPMDKYYNATFMSFNIRLDTTSDSGMNQWSNRKDAVCNFILDSGANVVCMQEVKVGQKDYISQKIESKYGFIWYGRDNNEGTKGEGLAIAYDKSVWNLLEQSFFFLSETPDVASLGWGAAHNRICVVASLENKDTGDQIDIYNVHLDHVSLLARENGIKLVVSRMEESVNPVYLCGDFNCTSADQAYAAAAEVLTDCQQAAPVTETGATYHNWGNISDTDLSRAIDFCFVSNKVIVPMEFKICRDKWGDDNSNFISDHYPIKVNLKIRKSNLD